jgi:long-chain fatty acid transport protein
MLYGNGGLNTTYPGSGPGTGTFYAGPTGVNLVQIFLAPTYARAINDRLALGVSLTGSYQAFRATGLANFGPFVSDGNPSNLANRGADSPWGIGGRLGVLYDVSPRLTLGAAYQSVTSQSKFAKYADLFAQQGGFNIPATVIGGLAWKVAAPSVIAVDVEHIWYGRIAAVANPFSNLNTGLASGNTSYLLGGGNGPGFGWRDTTFYKLGYQVDVSHRLTLRAGAAYGRQPIPSSDVLFDILAPGRDPMALCGRSDSENAAAQRTEFRPRRRADGDGQRTESPRGPGSAANYACDAPVGIRSGLRPKVLKE